MATTEEAEIDVAAVQERLRAKGLMGDDKPPISDTAAAAALGRLRKRRSDAGKPRIKKRTPGSRGREVCMADELGPAIAALQRKLEDQLQGVADTKRTINMLLKMSGQPEQYAESDNERSGYVRSDQFYGKGVATAAAEYLAMRKQACQPDEILSALKAGGFDFDVVGWPENDRLRSLAISLAKNTGGAGKFHRLKNGAFGLRSWYDEDFLKKAASGAEEAKAGKAAVDQLLRHIDSLTAGA